MTMIPLVTGSSLSTMPKKMTAAELQSIIQAQQQQLNNQKKVIGMS